MELCGTACVELRSALELTVYLDADVLNKLSGSPQLKYTLTNAQGSSLANVDSQGEPQYPLH